MFPTVFRTELLKLRRSKVTVLTLVAFMLAPLGGGLFMWIIQEPERASQLGLIGAKASFIGLEASWTGFFLMLNQAVGIAGMLLLAVIAAYVFGREYAEGTAKNMLALPVARPWFVLAKFLVVALWWAVLVAAILVESLFVGTALGLGGLSGSALMSGAGDVLLSASVVFLLTPVVAWIATLARGYLPPLGFAMLTLLLGNIFGATGWGKWFPWSIAPLFAGVAGPRVEVLAPGSIVVVVVTGLAGVAATVGQVVWGDNAQ